MVRKAIYLFLTTVAVLCLSCSKSPEEQKAELFADGMELLNRYESAEALQAFARINEIDPSDPSGQYGQGVVLERQGLILDALRIYLALNEARPLYPEAYLGAYRVYTLLGEREEALGAAARWAELRQDEPDRKVLVANAAVLMGQEGRARRILDTVMTMGYDDATVAVARAWSFAHEAEFDSAQSVAAAALQSPGATAEFDYFLANYYENIGRFDSALAVSERAMNRDDADWFHSELHFRRALKYQAMWDARRILEQLKLADSTAYWTHAHAYALANRRYRDASRFTDLVGIYHPASLTHTYLGMLSRGRSGEVMAVTDDAMLLSGTVVREEMTEQFQFYVLYLVARLMADYGEVWEAIRYLEGVPGQRANSPAIQIALTRKYWMTGQGTKARDKMELLDKFHSREAVWQSGLGLVAEANGTIDPSPYYRKALDLDKYYQPALDAWIDYLDRKRMFNEALKVLDEYRYLLERSPFLQAQRALFLARANRADEAVAAFEAAIKDFPRATPLYSQLFETLYRAGFSQHALEVTQLALELDPDNPDTHLLASWALLRNSEYRRALEVSRTALALDESMVEASAIHIYADYVINDDTATGTEFDRLFEIVPHNAFACLYYSQYLINSGGDAQYAANLARTATFETSHEFPFWVNLIDIYVGGSRPDLALGEARKMHSSYPNDPRANYYLGMLIASRDTDEARRYLNKALELGLPDPEATRARDQLQDL